MTATNPPTLQIRLFGPFEVRIQGRPLPRLRSRKGQWLFAFLALHHNREIEREFLAAMFWPEAEVAHALTSLRQSLSDLRAALGSEAWRLTSPHSHSLQLNLEGTQADFVDFDAALACKNADGWTSAIALYRGRMLEGCLEDWAEHERLQRHERYLSALESLANHRMAQGDLASAISTLRQAVAADPLHESAYRVLMTALSANGDYADATCVYRDLRLYLRQELNSDPEPATIGLFQRLRSEAQQQAEPSVRRKSPEITSDRTDALTLPTTAEASLPRPLNQLIGRENDAEEVRSLLRSGRLVTLAGSGGIGKTRLAIQVGEEARSDYPDGICFVDLASLKDPTLLPWTVAKTLGIAEQPDRSLHETLLEYLAGRNILLILDNCEHLVEACAHLAEMLLSACPQLHLLATSQQALGIAGEIIWRVPSLSLPPTEQLPTLLANPDSLLEYSAIHLFVERGVASTPRFSLSPSNAPAIAQICQRLDGIPLALELAAARLPVLTVDQIAARLDDRFRLLTGGSRTAMPRQQTLRAALDWSHDLLSPTEQVVLRRLSVFAGGATLAAAEAVCSDDTLLSSILPGEVSQIESQLSHASGVRVNSIEILEVLTQLVVKSFVWVDMQEEETRYRLPETTRAYALQQLEASGEGDRLQECLADYYCHLVDTIRTDMPEKVARPWYTPLETETDNLRTVLEWLTRPVAVDGACQRGLQMIKGTLGFFWLHRGYISEGLSWTERMLAVCSDRSPDRASVEMYAGKLALYQNDADSSRSHFEAAMSIYREQNDATEITRSLNGLGKVAELEGDWATAHRYFSECLTRWKELDNLPGVASAHNNLGVAANAQRDFISARAHHEACMAINRRLNNANGIAWSLDNLAETYLAEGNLKEARCHFLESLAIFYQAGHRTGVADCLAGLAEILQDVANHEADTLEAVKLFAAADRLRESIGMSQSSRDKRDHERRHQELRKSLGETQYQTAWQAGRSLSPDQAVALVERLFDPS